MGGAAREIFPLPGAAAGAATARPVMAANVPPPNYPPRPPQNNSQVLGWIGVACLILGFILPIILPTIAAMILGLIGADTAKRHNDSTGLVVSRIAWIGAVVTMALGVLLIVLALAFAWPFLAALFQIAHGSRSATGQGTNALIAFLDVALHGRAETQEGPGSLPALSLRPPFGA